MSIPSLQAKAFLAALTMLTDDVKKEILIGLVTEFGQDDLFVNSLREPLYDGKTSREITKNRIIKDTISSDMDLAEFLEDDDIDGYYRNKHLRSLIPHRIIAGLIEDVDDFGLWELVQIMADSLSGYIDHEVVENTVKMILDTIAVIEHHDDTLNIFNEYNVLRSFKKDGEPIEWKDFPNDESCEPIARQSSLSHPLNECISRYLGGFEIGDISISHFCAINK